MVENLNYQPKQSNNNNEPIPIPIVEKCLEKKTAICQISKKGNGFFCKLNLKKKSITALLTNNHILNEDTIKIGSKIEIEHNKKKKLLK